MKNNHSITNDLRLNDFLTLSVEHSGPPPLSISTLIMWLQNISIRRIPVCLVTSLFMANYFPIIDTVLTMERRIETNRCGCTDRFFCNRRSVWNHTYQPCEAIRFVARSLYRQPIEFNEGIVILIYNKPVQIPKYL